MRNNMGRAMTCALAGAAAASLVGAGPAQARMLSVREEGKLGYVKSSGSQVIDEGPMRGTLPGFGRVHFTYTGSASVSASFTISGHGWLVSGRATGRLSNPNSYIPSFRGKLTLTSGTGRYAHASGSGELFGVFNRHNYALTVQAIGKLDY
jgi:hypothetical protein